MKIGILAATLNELHAFLDPDSGESVSGDLRHEIHVMVTGIGNHLAQNAIIELINTFYPDLIIVTGSCGGLSPELLPGHLIIVTVTRDLEKIQDQELYIDQRVSKTLEKCIPEGIISHSGKMISTRDFIKGATEKESLGICYNALAIDMESAVINRVCHDQNIPIAIIKVVIDSCCTEASSIVTYLKMERIILTRQKEYLQRCIATFLQNL